MKKFLKNKKNNQLKNKNFSLKKMKKVYLNFAKRSRLYSDKSSPLALTQQVNHAKKFNSPGFDAQYTFEISSAIDLYSYSKIYVEFSTQISPLV